MLSDGDVNIFFNGHYGYRFVVNVITGFMLIQVRLGRQR